MSAQPQLIGEYLLADGKITPEQLNTALALQAKSVQGGQMLLGTILLEIGAVNKQDLAFALEAQERARMRVA